MQKPARITISEIVTKVANTTHLESSVAQEAVLAAVGGMRYASVGKKEVIVKVNNQGIELGDAYDNEDLMKNVMAGSYVNAEEARQIVSCVGATVSEYLSSVKVVDVERLGIFEITNDVTHFKPTAF